jgi:phosphonate transport system substrate-binding protein
LTSGFFLQKQILNFTFQFYNMKRIVCLLLFIGAALYLPAQSIRLATYQYAHNDRIKNIQPFADHLKNKYGYEVTVKSYATVHAFIKAIQDNEVDIALINTFGYLLLEASGMPYSMHPVAALDLRTDAKDNYKTAVLINPSVKANKLADLKKISSKLKLALVSPGSTSGNLVPRLALSGAGLPEAEKSFANVEYAKTHAAAVEAILHNNADVAAMGHTEYEKYVKQDPLNEKKMKLLWLSPEIPLGPVLFNNRFGSAVGGELQRAILELHLHDNKALESIKAGWSEAKQTTHFVQINATHYNAFKKVLGKKKDLMRILKQFAG